jgi:hypothetical protein
MRTLALLAFASSLFAFETNAHAYGEKLQKLHCQASNGVRYESVRREDRGLQVRTTLGMVTRDALARLSNLTIEGSHSPTIITLTVSSPFTDSHEDRYLLELDGVDPTNTGVQSVSGRVSYGYSFIALISCDALQFSRPE